MRNRVYRICEAPAWAQTQTQGELPLSALDRRDGYVHLSTARQVPATLARHFAGRGDLVLLTIDRDRLVDGSLIHEPPSYAASSAPAAASAPLFPHFYGRVPADAIVAADPLPRGPTGRHVLPGAVIEAIAAERDDHRTIDVRVVWDPRTKIVFLDYPRPSRIADEASVYAWEATLERTIEPVVQRHGSPLPVVIGIDNLSIAAKLERRYAELADKVVSRWFGPVARWTTRECNREFFSRVNGARELPSRVFTCRSEALAYVLDARAWRRSSA